MNNMKLLRCCSRVYCTFPWLLFVVYCCNKLTECGVFAAADPSSTSVSCRLVDNRDKISTKHFDLSSLATAGVWELLDNEHLPIVKKFYLSVCRSLDMEGTLCPEREAAVCVTNIVNGLQKPNVTNAGKVSQELQLQGEGRIVLQYDHGQSCIHMGHDIGYRTIIYFMCDKTDGSLAKGPAYQGMVGNCEYSFLWSTAAACPIQDYDVVNSCTIKLRNSDHTMNLLPLRKDSFYTVNGKNRTFEMNICDVVKGGHCGEGVSICETNAGETLKEDLGMKAGMELKYEDELLKLFYYSLDKKGNSEKTEILLLCSDSVHRGMPTFDGEEGNTLNFVLKTPLACVPNPVDCMVSDGNSLYDLSPLTRMSDNWEVADTRVNHADLQYHINVCIPVNSVPSYTCPGGNVGACQTSILSNISFNLGYIQGKPKLEKDGSVLLRYHGGSVCRGGSYMRSTEIIFYCSEREGGPQFQGETQDCIYKFEWFTPAACSVQDNIGKDCTVTDNLYGYRYDFRPLHRTDEDYKVNGTDDTFLINVCGKTVHQCHGQNSTGVCRIGKSGEMDVGKYNGELISHDGSLSMLYADGELCNGTERASSIIVFVCDHTAKKGHPEYLISGEDCSYYFLWKTSVSCPEFREIECSVRDTDGNEYDLSSLSLPSSNYRIMTTDGETEFVINVCRSVVHGSGARCQQSSGVCMVNTSETDINKKYVNLGDVEKGPFLHNGKLRLEYTMGDLCADQNTDQTHMKTVIDFKCDMTRLESEPEFLYHNHCEYVFLWEIAAACRVKRESKGADMGTSGDNCTTSNPITGFRFDMNPLKKEKGYQVSDRDVYNFDVNVCGPVIGNACGSDVGSCQSEKGGETRHWNAGKANSHLHFHHGMLYLNYTQGDKCGGGANRNTIINFICGAEGVTEEPTFIAETNCSYEFNWPTEEACERRVHCATTGSHIIDLSPLIKSNGNYKITVDSYPPQEFVMNVCRPVNSVRGLSCPAGSASCLRRNYVNGMYKNVLSLGHPLASPVWDPSNKTVQLMYFHGSPCPLQPENSITSKIIFHCKEGVYPGIPVLEKMTHDCQYIFTWATDIVCEKSSSHHVQVNNGDNCTFFHAGLNSNISLYSLRKETGYEVIQDNATFILSICGTKSKCKDAAVCRKLGSDWISYGTVTKVFYDYTLKGLRMQITRGDHCLVGGTNKGEVWFQCDVNAGKGEPELYGIYPCYVVFVWKTDLVCESFSDTAHSDPSHTDIIEENHVDALIGGTNTAGIVVGVMLSASVLCILFLLVKNPEQRRKFQAKVRNWLGFRWSTKVKYSRLSTVDPEVSSLLGTGAGSLQASNRDSDEDEDLLGI